MQRKITIPGELSLTLGIVLTSIAVSFMVYADLGISTISSLPYALSVIFDDVSFGAWNLVFQACLLVLLVGITRHFKTGYIVSIVIATSFGLALDVFVDGMSFLPADEWCKVLYFIISYPIMCLAISLMVNSRIPLMVVDNFINDLTVHFHVTYRRMKTIFDIICLALSVIVPLVALGHLAGVGIGTVIMALITGAGVQAASKLLGRYIVIKPWSETLGRMAI
ncbi:MAG: DUF6198 family protein [Methanomassiliicoccales archaeon]|nr:DUF6198 family protein [Methanomassiliicoccales archaeon]